MSDVLHPFLKSQCCHLFALSCLLSCFSCPLALSVLPFFFFFFFFLLLLLLMVHSLDFFKKTLKHFSLRIRLFCMAVVEQLGDDSWQVVCAACCRMALIFAIMH